MYTPDKNKLETFLRIDGFWSEKTSPGELRRALSDSNWRVQQAALSAIGDGCIREMAPDILQLLSRQDRLDVYGAKDQDEWTLDRAPDESVRETWACRFRVKQAACIALGRIGEKHGIEAIGLEGAEKLKYYAVSQDDDYPVRAAACQALGRCLVRDAVECLKTAASDGEWCTMTEAKKALSAILKSK